MSAKSVRHPDRLERGVEEFQGARFR